MPHKAEPKPPNRLVHTISLDGDATDRLVTSLTFNAVERRYLRRRLAEVQSRIETP